MASRHKPNALDDIRRPWITAATPLRQIPAARWNQLRCRSSFVGRHTSEKHFKVSVPPRLLLNCCRVQGTQRQTQITQSVTHLKLPCAILCINTERPYFQLIDAYGYRRSFSFTFDHHPIRRCLQQYTMQRSPCSLAPNWNIEIVATATRICSTHLAVFLVVVVVPTV